MVPVRRILIVTAVAAEADSVSTGLGLGAPEQLPLPGGLVLRRHPGGPVRADVLVGGVGPAAVAASTGTALAHATLMDAAPDGGAPLAPPGARAPYDLVVSAGIAGGFQPLAPLGAVVVATDVVAADLGAQTPDGYLTVDQLGFGRSSHGVGGALIGRIAAALDAGGLPHVRGPVLTVSTVTGTAERAAELAARHPGAAAEAMEGFGVAEAAAAYGVPVVEIRAVSNAVGPRDRAAWRIGEALGALRQAFALLSPTVLVSTGPVESSP
ncbi:futalosine hydrolase [Streptomyces venezuelae]|uniref:futalosine hydrolase n=1 Tax=Streptomyces venezuelae TaxID=54571 RepID=UPI00278C3ECD|nr:futalosine hydrolase [Streptomyces venezuelae]